MIIKSKPFPFLIKYDYTALVEGIPDGLKYINKIKLNMYSIWHNCMSILLLFYYWLHVSGSKGHHQANIYTKHKNAGAYGKKVYFLFYLLLYFMKIDFLY